MAEMKLKNCSKCGGEIRSCIYLGVELEGCQNCGGFFLDSKLVQKIPALAQSDSVGVKKRADQSTLDRATMVCPKCQCSMAKRINKKRKALVLDVCPSCQGIWFDAGEYSRYCGLNEKGIAERAEAYKACLYCETCDEVLWKPEKEQNVCRGCGNRLNLELMTVLLHPFWYKNNACAVILFVLGAGIIYFSTLKVLGDVRQAALLSGTLGLGVLIFIIRVLIYNKFALRSFGGRGREIELD